MNLWGCFQEGVSNLASLSLSHRPKLKPYVVAKSGNLSRFFLIILSNTHSGVCVILPFLSVYKYNTGDMYPLFDIL